VRAGAKITETGIKPQIGSADGWRKGWCSKHLCRILRFDVLGVLSHRVRKLMRGGFGQWVSRAISAQGVFRVGGPNNCAEIRGCGPGREFRKLVGGLGLSVLCSWAGRRIINKVMLSVVGGQLFAHEKSPRRRAAF
jgi:hypothetical protein